MWNRRGHALALAAMLAIAWATPASAQLSISVSPIRVEQAIQPGKTRTDVVTVENVSDQLLRARVTVADWFLERNGTPVFVKHGARPELSMSDWVDVNPTEFTVAPGDDQVIRFTVTVPDGVPAASYRTAILIESLPDFAVAPVHNAAYLTARIGVIVYNRIGEVAPAVEIVGQEVVGTSGEMAINLTVRNPGLVHVRISGISQIVTPQGRVLQELPIEGAVVLPRSERDILIRLRESIDQPSFKVLSQIDIGLEELLEVETQVGIVPANQQ